MSVKDVNASFGHMFICVIKLQPDPHDNPLIIIFVAGDKPIHTRRHHTCIQFIGRLSGYQYFIWTLQSPF